VVVVTFVAVSLDDEQAPRAREDIKRIARLALVILEDLILVIFVFVYCTGAQSLAGSWTFANRVKFLSAWIEESHQDE
jgi:hypothetical protein